MSQRLDAVDRWVKLGNPESRVRSMEQLEGKVVIESVNRLWTTLAALVSLAAFVWLLHAVISARYLLTSVTWSPLLLGAGFAALLLPRAGKRFVFSPVDRHVQIESTCFLRSRHETVPYNKGHLIVWTQVIPRRGRYRTLPPKIVHLCSLSTPQYLHYLWGSTDAESTVEFAFQLARAARIPLDPGPFDRQLREMTAQAGCGPDELPLADADRMAAELKQHAADLVYDLEACVQLIRNQATSRLRVWTDGQSLQVMAPANKLFRWPGMLWPAGFTLLFVILYALELSQGRSIAALHWLILAAMLLFSGLFTAPLFLADLVEADRRELAVSKVLPFGSHAWAQIAIPWESVSAVKVRENPSAGGSSVRLEFASRPSGFADASVLRLMGAIEMSSEFSLDIGVGIPPEDAAWLTSVLEALRSDTAGGEPPG